MRFGLKNSVRLQLTITILLAILVSWVLSSATATLLMVYNIRVMREEMLLHPQIYPHPIPEARVTIGDLLFGPGLPFARDVTNPPPGEELSRPQPPPADQPPANPHAAMGNTPPGWPPPPGAGPPPGGPPPLDGRPPATRQPGNGVHPGLNQPPGSQPGPGGPPQRPASVRISGVMLAMLRIGLAMLLAVLSGAWLSRRFSQPLSQLASGARALQAGKLESRIPVTSNDEFGEVAAAMNEMASRLAMQIRSLESGASRRRQFLADMAHELRSPVTTLCTMATALEEGVADDPTRAQHAVQAVSRTSRRLLHLVTDLLELAKLDLHELPMHLQPVDIRELAGASLRAHTEKAVRADIALKAVIPGNPMMVHADPDRLTQVLDNLIDNAISYAGKGATVRVELQEGNPVRIAVIDTGRGIPGKHLPHLFDPFYRADAARTPGDAHSGLGLRIARSLIETHNGTLTIQSAEGKGTMAVITLPAEG